MSSDQTIADTFLEPDPEIVETLRDTIPNSVMVGDSTQLLYAAKESGGNPKATHVHGDIDESCAKAGVAAITEDLEMGDL